MQWPTISSQHRRILPYLMVVIILAAGIRLVLLGTIPPGLHPDEMDFVLTAKSIYVSGKDISGTWSPGSLTTKKYDKPLAELTSLVAAPIIGPQLTSLWAARLPYLINQILLLVVVYLLTSLLVNSRVGLVAAMVWAVNPWSFQFSRLSFEAPIAATCYLAAAYVILSKKRWQVMWALPWLGLGFFTYHGAKLMLVPWVVAVVGARYVWANRRPLLKPMLGLIAAAIGLMLVYGVSFNNQAAHSRSEELIPLAKNLASLSVDHDRLHSIASPWMILFSNKGTFVIGHMVDRELAAFSTKLLFTEGEPAGPYSTHDHGFFYPLDFLLILVALASLYHHRPKTAVAMVALTLLAPLPGVISAGNETFGHRGSLMFPLLAMFVAYGWYIVATSKHRRIYLLILVPVYILMVVNYFYLYFYRYPAYAGQDNDLGDRVLARYLMEAKKNYEHVWVVTNSSRSLEVYEQYIYYGNLLDRASAAWFASSIQRGNYSQGNVLFVSVCPEAEQVAEQDLVVTDEQTACPVYPPLAKMNNINLSGTAMAAPVYRIKNDRVCRQFDLNDFIHPTTWQQFRIEQLSVKDLCQTWFTKNSE